MVAGARIAPHGSDAIPVDGDRIARRTGVRRVAASIAAAQLQLLKTIVVSDLLTVGMPVVVIPVPHLDVCRALALFHDLVDRGKSRGERIHRDDAASTREWRGRDLASRVAAEHARLSEIGAQRAQPATDGFVELADGLVSIALGSIAGRGRPLDLQKDLEGLTTEGEQRNLERPIAVRKGSRVGTQ